MFAFPIRKTARHVLSACTAVAFSAGILGAAQATVLVHVVQNDPTPGDASIVPQSSLPSADFLSPDINFNTNCSDCTALHDFLNNPVFFNQQNGFNPNAPSSDNIFLQVKGSTKLLAGTNSFVVGHDDGVVLTFDDPSIGTVVNQPGPTGFTNTPFDVNVATEGLYSFTLNYTECCGGPTNLVFRINDEPVGTPSVPEPATLAVLGLGLAAAGFARRRRAA